MAYKRSEESRSAPAIAIALLFLVALAARLTPLITGPTDPDAYYHERMVQTIAASGAMPDYDARSYGGREYSYYPLAHALPAAVAVLLGASARQAIEVTNLILGMAGVALVWLLARKKFGNDAGFWALAAAAILPAFVARGAALARPEAFALVLLPAALLLTGRKWLLFALFVFGALYHLPSAAIALAIVAAAIEKKFDAAIFAATGFVVGAIAYGHVGTLLGAIGTQAFRLSSESMPLDWTALVFFTGPFLVFAAAGWSLWTKDRAMIAWLAAGAVLSAFASRNVLFLAPVLAIAAGVGVTRAVAQAKEYGNAIIALFVIAAAASFIIYAVALSPAFLPQDDYAAMQLGGQTVVSWWDRGHLLTYHGAIAVADGWFEGAPQLRDRIDATNRVMSGDVDSVYLMNAFGARYVFFDSHSVLHCGAMNIVFDDGARICSPRGNV